MGAIGLFLGGSIIGATLMYLHYREMIRATNRERNKHEGRIQELESERVVVRCMDAYRRGKEEGRLSPATAAEQFAKTFEDKRVQFRG